MKKKLRRFISGCIALSMLVFILTGCGSEESSSKAEDGEVMKLKFGTSPWPTSMFAYLADELGIFKKHGLEVDLNTFSSFSDSLQAFVGGNLDILTTPSSDTIAPYSQGADFDVIMLTDKSLGSDGMVAKSNIHSIADLKGKSVATELYTVDHMYLLSLLDENGLSSEDVKIVNMSISDAGTAFIAGKVDAAVIWEPYLSKAVAEGKGNLVYSTKENPDLITDSIVASRDSIENNSKAVQAFVDSWYEAVDYWKNNKKEAEKIMAKHLEVSEKEFSDMMDKLYIATADDAIESFKTSSNETSFVSVNQNIAEFLKKLKVIDETPDVSKMLNTKFIENSK